MVLGCMIAESPQKFKSERKESSPCGQILHVIFNGYSMMLGAIESTEIVTLLNKFWTFYKLVLLDYISHYMFV